MFELNEAYLNCPTKINEYIIDGKKYIVHSHFIGEKDIDTVISGIAMHRAESDIFVKKAA